MACKIVLNERVKDVYKINEIAKGLMHYLSTGEYPAFLGHYGQFENNPRAMDSMLHKLHIVLSDAEKFDLQWDKKTGYRRTSDNFLVYAEHWCEQDFHQILDIITPKAHDRIDEILPTLIDEAEKFQALNKAELDKLPSISDD